MSKCRSIVLSAAEQRRLIARIEAKTPLLYLAASVCDGCNKVLPGSELESPIRGYASGEELGLCRRCASHVNTPQAVDAAVLEGHAIKAPVVTAGKLRQEGVLLD